MKKLSVAAILAFCLFLTACGTSASSDQKSSTKSAGASVKNESSTKKSPTNQKRSGKIAIVTIGGKRFEMELYDNPSARALIKVLPMTITASRWGDGEYYGEILKPIPSKGKKTAVFDVGEIGLWPAGNAFCIFFGPTPVSDDDQPKMDSSGIPLGKITSDVSSLKSMADSVDVTVTLK